MNIGTKVIAPLGVASVASMSTDNNILVCYSRRNYTPDQWRVISPANGPCVFRMYSQDEVTEVSDE